jgi:hypothetical protein
MANPLEEQFTKIDKNTRVGTIAAAAFFIFGGVMLAYGQPIAILALFVGVTILIVVGLASVDEKLNLLLKKK